MVVEDKSIGLKIAENPIIALWTNQIKAIEQDIKNSEANIMLNRAFLEKAREELIKAQINQDL